MNDLQKIALAVAIAAGVILYMNLLCAIIAWWSGWRLLSHRFRNETISTAQIGRWQSARMRAGCAYNNALYVGADSTGLSLRTLAIVPRHPPLLIPWSEIHVEHRKQFLWWTFITLRLGLSERIPFTIRESLFDQIERAPGVPPLLVRHNA